MITFVPNCSCVGFRVPVRGSVSVEELRNERDPEQKRLDPTVYDAPPTIDYISVGFMMMVLVVRYVRCIEEAVPEFRGGGVST